MKDHLNLSLYMQVLQPECIRKLYRTSYSFSKDSVAEQPEFLCVTMELSDIFWEA